MRYGIRDVLFYTKKQFQNDNINDILKEKSYTHKKNKNIQESGTDD